jgi:hypothetical protein
MVRNNLKKEFIEEIEQLFSLLERSSLKAEAAGETAAKKLKDMGIARSVGGRSRSIGLVHSLDRLNFGDLLH